MNRKLAWIVGGGPVAVVLLVALYIGHTVGVRAGAALPACIAEKGEICPSDDFKQELKTFKALGDRQRTLSQDPKIKELISVMDQQRGMSDRMQQEINQTLQQNPGHAWDGTKEKFVVAAPSPQPAAVPTVPAQAPAQKK